MHQLQVFQQHITSKDSVSQNVKLRVATVN